MKHILLVAYLFCASVSAETLSGNYELSKSKVAYLVTYLIKKADGESVGSKGKGECKSDGCEFLVAAPIKTFTSKDNNRDLNMLTVVKADKFPLVVANIKTKGAIANGRLITDVEIQFAGVKKMYSAVPFTAKSDGTGFHVEGKINLILTEYKIERPSLLGVSINDEVPLTIEADWKKN